MTNEDKNMVTVFTADDEEPQCNRCDNRERPDTFCVNNCGGGHCWNGYERTVMHKSEVIICS